MCVCVQCACVFIFRFSIMVSIRKIHDFIHTQRERERDFWVEGVSLKTMAAMSTDYSLSPLFSQSICYAWSHIYHMPVPRICTVNRVHITSLAVLLPPSLPSTPSTTPLPPPPPSSSSLPPPLQCRQQHYRLRTIGLFVCLVSRSACSFVRSFTGNMTETRTQNTNYVYMYKSLLGIINVVYILRLHYDWKLVAVTRTWIRRKN